jgi:predicted dehydrogenase
MVSRLGIGVVGCGAVFSGGYTQELLALRHRAHVRVVCDIDRAKAEAAALDWNCETVSSFEEVIAREDVDVVCILTSMPQHAEMTIAALEAQKHVLLEKPIATTVADAETVVAAADKADVHLVCAPHTMLSPAFAGIRAIIDTGEIGTIKLARARYGWAGPDWAEWFYRRGGGALFDLGVYSLTTLCGLLGRVERVSALTATAVPLREVNGTVVHAEATDSAQILLDFGDNCFASVTTGFTMQRYRAPAVELYGLAGTVQLLGDDWAPDGYEIWRNDRDSWEYVPTPPWRWTNGLTHLVDCIEADEKPQALPRNALHILEVMLAAEASSLSGAVVAIASPFARPNPLTVPPRKPMHRLHDPSAAP